MMCRWCRKAAELHSQEPKYTYTLAFYQKEQKDLQGAQATLKDLLTQRPGFIDGYLLLAEVYAQLGERPQAETLLRQVLQRGNLPPQDRNRVAATLQRLSNPGTAPDDKRSNRKEGG
jgi:predicted Zn-dependent protease